MDNFAPLQSATIAELRAINSTTTLSDQFYVTNKGHEGIWYYDPADTTSADNTATVLVSQNGRRLKRVFESEISVTWFGAKGDGNTDDTVSIQNAINFAADNVSVRIPKGTFLIRADFEFYDDHASGFLIDKGGIYLNDNSTLLLDEECYLKAVGTLKQASNVIRIHEKKNVTIKGGHIIGDRYYTGKNNGEWGYGLAISGCENVYVENLKASDCWGDGFNLQVTTGDKGITINKHIYFNKCISNNNRRQGLSIEGGTDLTFFACQFTNTRGKGPECGVDIEPYSVDNLVDNVLFDRCYFKNNAAAGLQIWGNSISNVKALNCIFTGDDTGAGKGYHHLATGHNPKNITWESCNFDNGVNQTDKRGATIRGGTDLLFLNNTITAVHFQINEDPGTDNLDIYITYSIIFKGNTFVSDDQSGNNLASLGSTNVCKAIIIENNIFNCVNSANKAGLVIYLESKSNQLKFNTFLNIKNGIVLGGNVTSEISFNTFHNSISHLIEVRDNAIINGNTFYGPCSLNTDLNHTESIIRIKQSGSTEINGNDVIIQNNIIHEKGIRDTQNTSKAKCILGFDNAAIVQRLDFINNKVISPSNPTPLRDIGTVDAEYTDFFVSRKNLYQPADSASYNIPTYGYLPHRVKAGDMVFLQDTPEFLLIMTPFIFNPDGTTVYPTFINFKKVPDNPPV
ncbi:hypothetical protein TH53_18095 [Pedobacter lusitanus]|uniref:Pectate lyase superfamily protein domain-containing protein n=1 Tax=Pedobacter lusitanus TaxID=1503925 RepID=A0A0D0GII8_9SPHI|nr:right-handed parallel beta-helix repeat-containing protein [Pedobacter lusitanus]KIO75885.1 hypothetical protein TH53_18095 [Pedobacter lusitanus]